jgi:hypothetical protein
MLRLDTVGLLLLGMLRPIILAIASMYLQLPNASQQERYGCAQAGLRMA